MTLSLPDSEFAIREWLKLYCAHSYFAVPKQDIPDAPFVISYKVSGGPDDKGQDYPDFIFECWGVNKHAASQLAIALAQVVSDEDTFRPPPVVGGVRILAGRVNSGPLPISGTTTFKRYRLDTSFHTRVA